VKAGLEDGQAALLVMIGALTDGRKVVLAVESGQREPKESWGAVLRDLRTRGLKPWRCTMADGQLGIWATAPAECPSLTCVTDNSLNSDVYSCFGIFIVLPFLVISIIRHPWKTKFWGKFTRQRNRVGTGSAVAPSPRPCFKFVASG